MKNMQLQWQLEIAKYIRTYVLAGLNATFVGRSVLSNIDSLLWFPFKTNKSFAFY